MKRLIWLAITAVFVILVSFSVTFGQKSIFLKADKENLRLSPQGTVIGQITKGVELIELERQGKWVKVAFSAWIWAASTTEAKDEALGPKNRASIIMLEFRQDADDVLNQIKAGKSFEEMAKAKSIHPTAQKGGDLGFFRKGDFNEKFETAIFALQPNQVSGIIEITLENKTYFCIFKRVQ